MRIGVNSSKNVRVYPAKLSPPSASHCHLTFPSPCLPSLRRCEACRREVSAIHNLLASSLPSWLTVSWRSVSERLLLVTVALHLRVLSLPLFWVESQSLFPERKASKIGSRPSLKRTTAERRTGLYKCSPSRKRISIKQDSGAAVGGWKQHVLTISKTFH